MKTTTANTAKAAHPCECGRFIVHNLDGTTKRVPCGGVTKRTFAPGHDARLKGILIRAELAGSKVERTGKGNNGAEPKSPMFWADSFGFGYQVRHGVALGRNKAAAKQAKKAQPEPVEGEWVPEVEVPEEELAYLAEIKPEPRAKVGRWVYTGCIEGNEFVYHNAKGEELRTTRFTLVDDEA